MRGVSRSETPTRSPNDEWPAFSLRYTFNPGDVDATRRFEPDELVVRDPRRGAADGAWLSAGRGSYVAIEDVR